MILAQRTSHLLVVAFLTAVAGASAQSGAVPQESGAVPQEPAAVAQEGGAVPQEPAAPQAPPQEEAPTMEELARRIDLLAEELEIYRLGEAAGVRAQESYYGMGPAASKIYQTGSGLSWGGYGEVLYQDFSSDADDGSASGKTDTFDLLRAVLYVGYQFDEHWLLNTEIEYEHATTSGGRGSVSMEFAYLDYLHSEALNVRGGLVLIPMGFVNELHEPTTFFSARRPGIETYILPTTWRENGVGLFGEWEDFRYRTYVVNGFDAAGYSAEGLRGGRQKGGKAKAEDLAWVGRVDWEGVEGLLVGASLYSGGAGQDLGTAGGASIDATTTLYELHAQYECAGWSLRGLFTEGRVSDVADLNAALGLSGMESVGKQLRGYYVEGAFDVFTLLEESTQSLSPFLRWESFDTQADVPAGFQSDPANDVDILTFGLAWQPMDQIILKLDYQDIDDGAGTGVDQWNVALGYIF